MARAFLDAIRVNPEPDTDEETQARFATDKKKYGFPSHETWNLDTTMAALLYERLKLYNEVTAVDTTYHTIEHNGNEITVQEAIDLMLDCAEEVLTHDDSDYANKLSDERFGESEFEFEDSPGQDLSVLVDRSPLDDRARSWYHKRMVAIEDDAHNAAQELWDVWAMVFPHMWW